MSIEELKLKDILPLLAVFSSVKETVPPVPEVQFWVLGKNYFIRTVTHHHTGELVAVTNHEIILRNAAWIADDGKFTEAVASGDFKEVEIFPPNSLVAIGRGSIIDAVPVSNIPHTQK